VCGNENALKLGNRRKCQLHASAAEPLEEIVPLAIYIGGYVEANSWPGHLEEQLKSPAPTWNRTRISKTSIR